MIPVDINDLKEYTKTIHSYAIGTAREYGGDNPIEAVQYAFRDSSRFNIDFKSASYIVYCISMTKFEDAQNISDFIYSICSKDGNFLLAFTDEKNINKITVFYTL